MHRERFGGRTTQVDECDSVFGLDRILRHSLDQCIPERVLIASDLGGLAQNLADVGVVVALEQRKQFVPYPIARERDVGIGAVLTPLLPDRLQVGLYFGTRDLQHGSNDEALLDLQHRMDAGDPSRPGPSQHPQQYRLTLIVSRVRRRDLLCAAFGQHRAEQVVTQPPRSSLGTDPPLLREEWNDPARLVQMQRVLFRQPSDELRIGITFRPANPMIEMDHRKNKPSSSRSSNIARSSATESAPPDTAMPTRSPA